MFTAATVSIISTLIAWALYNNYAYTDVSQSPQWEDAPLSTGALKKVDIFEREDWNPESKDIDIMLGEFEDSDWDDLDESLDILSESLKIMNSEQSKSGLSETKLPLGERNKDESKVGSERKDESIDSKKEFNTTKDSKSGSSDAEDEKKAISELSHGKRESTHIKDDINSKAVQMKNESEKVNAKKSSGKNKTGSDETLNEQKPRSPEESFGGESLQEIAENIMNTSKNVVDLIIGDALKALDEVPSEKSEPTKTETKNATKNSIYVLYSLVSYIFNKENDELHQISEKADEHHIISEKANKDSNLGDMHLPSAALEQIKKFNDDVDAMQQFSNFRHQKMEINMPDMPPHSVHNTFISYVKGMGWESCITIAAVVVLFLVLMTFAVVWGTQFLRKRRNRIRLLRLQANENQQTI